MSANNVFPLANKRDWKWHRDRIATAWGKQVESIIETGQCLIEAKNELEHGAFEAMVQSKLPFGPRAARMLKEIAKHEIISNRKHASDLPASWATLHELTKLPHEILIAGLKDGSIHPKLERKDVRAMRPDFKDKPKPASRDELIAAIQKDPNANQRDAAAALGVSLGMYQRTRNELIGRELIGRSDIGDAALTLDQLHERIAALVRELPKEQRMRMVEQMMKAVDLNIRDWRDRISTITLGKKGSH